MAPEVHRKKALLLEEWTLFEELCATYSEQEIMLSPFVKLMENAEVGNTLQSNCLKRSPKGSQKTGDPLIQVHFALYLGSRGPENVAA